jgi:frataxin-like iron-binding protein CyaY
VAGSLAHDSVWDILIDHQETIWVATYFGGVNYANPSQKLYRSFTNQSQQGNSLSYFVLGQMVEDAQQNIWLATEGGGLDFIDRSNNQITNYAWFDHPQFEGKNIKSLYLHQNNTLLIGTHEGGLFKLDLNNMAISPLNIDSNRKISITDMKPFGNQVLLASNLVVLVYDEGNENLEKPADLFGKPNITGTTSLLVDHRKRILIGTKRHGIIRIAPATNEREYFNSQNSGLLSNDVFKFFMDSKNQVWIGTVGGGLALFDEKFGTIQNYTRESHGLPSDLVYGIAESSFGNYWIATSRGLSRFNLEKGRFYNLDSSTGFPISEINRALWP